MKILNPAVQADIESRRPLRLNLAGGKGRIPG